MKSYIVTAAEKDCAILKKLLPSEHVKEVVFVSENEESSAMSMARSILVARRSPVALVIDAQTTDSQALIERHQITSDLLRLATSSVPSEVFLVVPQMEVLFFEDREFLQKLLGNPLSDEEWHTGKFIPRKVLGDHLKENNIQSFLNQIKDVSIFQRSPFLKEINNFLVSLSSDTVTRN